MTVSEIYSVSILEIAGRLAPPNRLHNPDVSARRTSRICGSVVEVDLKVKNGVVTSYGQDVSACALGQTSASIMAQHIVGSDFAQLRQLRDTVFAMLKNHGSAPTGKWSDIKYLEAVRDFLPRHASTMLVFDAVVDCVDRIENPGSQ